jgi:ATP-dependent exoDNAse (exonuclease V) beta subunit
MIEKNVNVYKKSVKRLIEINSESKRINIRDNRYYFKDNKYYPSVTSILQYMPKGKFFENWLKDVGHNSDIIAKKAADEGTQVHEAIEKYLQGEKLNWLDENGYSKYSFEVWKMILKFHEFWTNIKPTLIENEIHLFSEIYVYAGTCDLIVEINGVRWLLDIKTSNSLHTSYDLQLAAYAQAWNELYEEKIDKIGIIWLKSSKRGEDKKGNKMQGKGWEIYEPEKSINENLKLFGYIHELYKLDYPDVKPTEEQFPTEIQINPTT